MRNPNFSSRDPKTGSVYFKGPLSLEKGDHSHMAKRDSSYRPADERGHNNASSTGGTNGKNNIVPQNRDVNHREYAHMEQGERNAMKQGATIYSHKAAIADKSTGPRPNVFMATDRIAYADGHNETIHHSFANESHKDQAMFNAQSAKYLAEVQHPNPGDSLRDSMSKEEYAALMEKTDAELPGITKEYEPTKSNHRPMPRRELAYKGDERGHETQAFASLTAKIAASAKTASRGINHAGKSIGPGHNSGGHSGHSASHGGHGGNSTSHSGHGGHSAGHGGHGGHSAGHAGHGGHSAGHGGHSGHAR